MRLNKFLSVAGVTSRRHADLLIKEGNVKVNGAVVTEFGVKIDPEHDVVELNGKVVTASTGTVIYLLNKPKGVVTTADDPDGKKTVLELVPKEPRVFPCGRLDINTMGLVLLTNDGNLCYQLTHPKFEHKKEYLVEGTTPNPDAALTKLGKPITLNDGPARIDDLRVVKKSGNKLHFYITIHDGRNHIVRRICAHCGIEIQNLTRTKLGQYELAGIEPGKYLELKP